MSLKVILSRKAKVKNAATERHFDINPSGWRCLKRAEELRKRPARPTSYGKSSFLGKNPVSSWQLRFFFACSWEWYYE